MTFRRCRARRALNLATSDEFLPFTSSRLLTTKITKMVLLLFLLIFAGFARVSLAQTIRVDITPDHATNTFRPTEALGAGVDRIPLAATDKIFTEPVINQILSAGWQTVTYRQN